VTNTISGSVSGNAGTATALAANGANCTAGSFPLGVNASGAAESCADNITGNAATATALAANGGNCVAGSFPLGVNASGAVESCADNITGNAATATALATARTINGVSFDGTANITVADSTKVPTTRTVNGYALSSNVTIAASDVGLGGGLSVTVTVRDNTGAANCNLVFTNGILTSETCP
jgi:hypothetical protein